MYIIFFSNSHYFFFVDLDLGEALRVLDGGLDGLDVLHVDEAVQHGLV